jgi:hypothetical protein
MLLSGVHSAQNEMGVKLSMVVFETTKDSVIFLWTIKLSYYLYVVIHCCRSPYTSIHTDRQSDKHNYILQGRVLQNAEL